MENDKAETGIIGYDDFCKVDIRVATIQDAVYHEGADKLLVLKLDIGDGRARTVCAGLRQHYKPEDLVGQQILYVANLAKRTMRGVESEGMILAATDKATGAVIIAGLSKAPNEGQGRAPTAHLPVDAGSFVK